MTARVEVDHAAVARVFTMVRRSTNSVPAAMRVALVAYRAMAPGLKGIGLDLPVERLARSFELAEQSLKEDGFDITAAERTERALRSVLMVPGLVKVPTSETKIRAVVARAVFEHGVTEEALRGSRRTEPLASIRVKVWHELVSQGVGPVEIGKWFGGRDHSTVTKCVQKYERDRVWLEAPRRAEAA